MEHKTTMNGYASNTSQMALPSGWVELPIREACLRPPGTRRFPKVKKTSYKNVGMLPVVDQGKELIAGFVDDYGLRYRGRLPVIVFGDHTRVLKYIDFPFAAGADGTRLIAPSLDLADIRFFYYALCNLRLKNLGYARHFKLLQEQTIRIPECLGEQREIAAVLSAVDKAIGKTRAVADQAQVVKRGVMQELLTRGLPGRHTRFRKTEIGVVPGGWGIASLGGLAQINPEQLGSGTDADYVLEYLDISAIERPGLIGDSQKYRFADAPSRARRIVRKGDILVSTVRPYLRNFACVREATRNLVASTGYAVVRPGHGVDGRFLYQYCPVWRPSRDCN